MKTFVKYVAMAVVGVLAIVYLGDTATAWLRALSSWLRTIS